MSKRNVAIYARVSTEHEAQLSALDNQVQYYDNIMAMHPDWVLYDRYIDEGITGTSTKKRKQFMRMIEDAHDGCFDLIVTREVSRFARNTVDTLQETRKLRRIGVEVYFTEDNIWTLNDEDGELRLTIMATLAQNESKKTSLRVKAGQKVSFQNGVLYGNGNILGYERVGHDLIINPEQAETVKLIYQLYLDGMGAKSIQYELEKRNRKTATGLSKWSAANITHVLKNPFYCGIIVYRKQYVPDFLEQKKINNFGDVEQTVVEGKHEPIISKEDFEEVQRLIKARSVVDYNGKIRGLRPVKTVWGRLLKCSCGCSTQKVKSHTTKSGENKYSYQCYGQVRTGTIKTRIKKGLSIEGICDVPMIQQWKLELMAKMIFDSLFKDKEKILNLADELLEYGISEERKTDYSAEILRCQNLLKKQRSKLDVLLELRLNQEIEPSEYKEKQESIRTEINKLESRIAALNNTSEAKGTDPKDKIVALKKLLKEKISFKDGVIPDAIIEALVEKIVMDKNHFIWKLKIVNKDLNCIALDKVEQDCSVIKTKNTGLVKSSTGSYR
ncbi:MAG: recombinase family protein [Eubacterium sp.]|nr:recombinase family protein [Eubacterium sp.]